MHHGRTVNGVLLMPHRVLHVIPDCGKSESEVLGCCPLAYCPRQGSWGSETWLWSWKLSLDLSVRLPLTVRLFGLFWRKESRLKTMKLDWSILTRFVFGWWVPFHALELLLVVLPSHLYSTTKKMQRFLDMFISINCSTCFRRFHRPSSGASGIVKPILLLSWVRWNSVPSHPR
jgi:hypothetical protein